MMQQQPQGGMMGMGPNATPPHNVQQMHPQMVLKQIIMNCIFK